jgi:UDP-glucose 4-epimerase
MTTLVTGGAGYIGSHAVLELIAADEKVVVLDNLSTGFRWAVPPIAKLIVGDFGDNNLVTEIIRDQGIDSIIHLAARTIVEESIVDPLGFYLDNTAKTRTLIQCAVEQGVRQFIFSSTAAVYGNPETEPVTEDELLKPISPYGRSKAMVEWILADAANAYELRYVILRFFNVAGADPLGRVGQSTPKATHLIKLAVQAALGRRNGMEVFGTDYATPDGTCVRDYIQVSDVARAHMDALHYMRAGGENLTCNCGYERGYSVLQVIEAVKTISGVDFPVKTCGRRAGDPAVIVASNALIKSKLGWNPKHDDLNEIIHQALDWERYLVSSKENR